MPTSDEIIAIIGTLSDHGELRRIRVACDQRAQALRKAAYDIALSEARARAQHWKPGTELWCCAQGTFIGGTIQRGTKLIVTHHKPRARDGWIIGVRKWGASKATRNVVGLTVEDVHRYNLRTVAPKPDNDAQKASRDAARMLGRILES